ncbi:molybdate ABC transporter substrate-binding protein [Halalkalibacter alkalisediminis]|uniref:Molybdate ABC transporter substrate-binding protein n=1 Tax=Halalkalibacter alkalisediminis TaxID=935616 RepID=A0ABV6NJS7_9BACI|nr:molybdate ABC transporter substrate-binding protein [Halalkalibacter alkalisediminis]
MMRSHLLLFLFVSLCLIGCSPENEAETLYVAAASDLYHALTEIGEAFTEETDIALEFTFGSTGLLTQQIQEGAPFDLFLAAHESYIDRLMEREALLPDSKAYYAIGRLVLMGPALPEGDQLALDYLVDPEVKTIAIANPEHAPYGKAAQEALETSGIWEEIQPKLVYAENIRQAYQYAESGNADVGIIALALMNETEFPYEVIDEDLHLPLMQALGIPAQTEKEELSRKLAAFILSEQGRSILQQYGFDLP